MTMQSDVISGAETRLPSSDKPLSFKVLARNRILIALVLTYFAAALVISTIISVPIDTVQPKYLALMLASVAPIFLVTMLIWRFGAMVLNVRPEKPIQWLACDLRDHLLRDHERILAGLLACVSIIFFAATFSYVKSAIPLMNPFSWDPTFRRMGPDSAFRH